MGERDIVEPVVSSGPMTPTAPRRHRCGLRQVGTPRIAAGLASILLVACGAGDAPTNRHPTTVGNAVCAECHDVRAAGPHVAALWKPTADLGQRSRVPFDLPRGFEAVGIRLGQTYVEQPLVGAPGGRLQALPIAWDVERGEWFDVFPESPSPTDWNHWRNGGMTANAQCLACHVTGYDAGYDAVANGYQSTWVDDGVTCEACHGPGGEHVAARRGANPRADDAYGTFSSAGGSMAPCASCHMRRTVIAGGYAPDRELFDHVDPDLLETELWAPDGSVVEEVFEWTSFSMSTMHAEGVACSNCHDAHTSSLEAEGNALCLRCHEPDQATDRHTHHPSGSTGAACVACHMPMTVFMERDRRRDHLFPRPDPALSMELGTRDPCTDCHADRSQGWAAQYVEDWWGTSEVRTRRRRMARAIKAAREGDAAAVPGLTEILDARDVDAIRRASAARLLERFPHVPGVVDALLRHTQDPDPLLRAAVMTGLGGVGGGVDGARRALVAGTRDPVRLVRLEAAFGLRSVPTDALGSPDRSAVQSATDEWLAARALNADQPVAHYNEGVLWSARGDLVKADTAYRRAIELWPGTHEARHNLGMLLAQQGRVTEAEEQFESILSADSTRSGAAFALGLLYAGEGKNEAARDALATCVASDPDYPRARYNLGLAHMKLGEADAAFAALEAAIAYADSRTDAVAAIVALAARVGDRERFNRWAAEAALAATP